MSEIWEAICSVPGVCWCLVWIAHVHLSLSVSFSEMNKDIRKIEKELREEIQELKRRVK